MNIHNAMLFLPFAYGFNTRAKTKIHKIAFIFFILGPCLLNALFMTSFAIDLVAFLGAFCGMYMVYEIGYIYNDIYTTQKEEFPTKWLKTRDMESFVQANYPLLISVRVLYVSLLIFVLLKTAQNTHYYIISLGILYFSFSLHNYYRNSLNIATDCLLNLFKYISPMIILINNIADCRFLFYLSLETVVPRTFEFAVGNNYAFKKMKAIDTDVRRVIYYFILSAIAGGLAIYRYDNIWFLYGSFYMLLYRISCLFIGKNDSIKKLRKENGDRNGYIK